VSQQCFDDALRQVFDLRCRKFVVRIVVADAFLLLFATATPRDWALYEVRDEVRYLLNVNLLFVANQVHQVQRRLIVSYRGHPGSEIHQEPDLRDFL